MASAISIISKKNSKIIRTQNAQHIDDDDDDDDDEKGISFDENGRDGDSNLCEICEHVFGQKSFAQV